MTSKMTSKTIALLAAVLLGSSAVAMAQTGTTNTRTNTQVQTAPSTQPNPQGGRSKGENVPGAAGYTEQKSGSTESMSPSSGAPGPQSARMSDQDVKKRIEQAGYSSVSDVDRSKNGGYTAQAMRNGKRVTVDVDSSGRIMAK